MRTYLSNLGYNNKTIDKMLLNKRFLIEDKTYLIRNIEGVWALFGSLGLTSSEIIKITKKECSLLEYDKSTLERKIISLTQIGFTNQELLKMIKLFPTILVLDIDKINGRINYWVEHGFKRNEIISMIKTFPAIIGYSRGYFTGRVEELKRLGYNMTDVKKIAVAYPQIFSLSIINIQSTLDTFEYCGLTAQQTMRITLGYPQIFGYSNQNLKEKLMCCKKLNIINYVVRHPMVLIGGVTLVMVRSAYLSSICVDYQANPAYLFMNSSRFEQKFKISNDELMTRYGKGSKNGISS